MTPTTASEFLTRAASLVSGDRAEAHGDMVESFDKIATAWNAGLAIAGKAPASPLTGHDVAMLMALLKWTRVYCGTYNPDDYVDGGGYFGCAGQVRAAREAEAQAPDGQSVSPFRPQARKGP